MELSGGADSLEIVLVIGYTETDQSITISADTDWKGVFEDVPKYDENGKLITYRVVEKITGYKQEYENDGNGGYIIYNTKVGAD